MSDGPYDPRAISNLILDFADSASLPVSHIALQKLLYFAHATFLVQRGKPLIKGPFEAWQFGPVHPAVYQAYKRAGEQPIKFRAKARNVLTGAESDVPIPTNPDVRLHVMQVVASYGRLSIGRLVTLSHADGGPWHYVVSATGDEGTLALGERIPDDVIRARFAARPFVGVKADHLTTDSEDPRSETEPPPPDRRSELRGA